jgi:phage terminase large subunit
MNYEIRWGDVNGCDFTPRGGAKDFMYCKDPEVIIAGPAETGKTLAACWLIHLTCSKYPDLHCSIIRKTQHSVYGSVLQTFQRVIKDSPVKIYGGEKPELFIYPNGSTVWVGGMDNADKVLSSERYIIYVNQAEELTLNDWELLTTRATGRGFNIPGARVMGDANPAGSKHWIRQRSNLTLIQSRHEDNPTLYDEHGNITEQGQRTLDRLGNLTGVRRSRLLLGQWSTAEGVVYDTFDANIHVKNRDDKEFVQWYLSCDEGYTNPAVILLVGVDSDGRWHIANEFYERGVLQSRFISEVKKYYNKYNITVVSVDESAAGLIADMQNNGVRAIPAKGRVLDGIQKIQDRLRLQGDGLPRLTVDPACVNVINEFESYVWKKSKDGNGKDEPLKENDHAMDAIRYLEDASKRYSYDFGYG